MIKRETITGPDGSPYLTRWALGRLRLHVFHRGDADPDPHTHPLVSYNEAVMNPETGVIRYQLVRAWRLHFRPASHAHLIVGPVRGDGKIVTLVWTGRKAKDWGFWYVSPAARGLGFSTRPTFIGWRTYLSFKGQIPPQHFNCRCTLS